MKDLYLLIGSYDEGADIVYPFYAYEILDVMQYILSRKDDYEPIFISFRKGDAKFVKTPEDLWNAIDRTYTDGDSCRGWSIMSFHPQNITDLSLDVGIITCPYCGESSNELTGLISHKPHAEKY